MASRLFRAVIMGPPGSGKGTISERVAHSFGLKHLSSGDFMRESIAAKTEAGVMAKTYIDKGLLVPDHVVTHVLLPRLEQMSGHSWILEGFPRTLAQATALDTVCELDIAITLNIPFETLKDRLSQRWVHPASGRVYNMEFNPPRVQGFDDISGEPLVQNEDDKPEVVLTKLRRYKDMGRPVIEFYKKKGILHSFSGTETDKIWPYINSLLSGKISVVQASSQTNPVHTHQH